MKGGALMPGFNRTSGLKRERLSFSARWSWFAIAALQLPEGEAPAHERSINVRAGMEAMERELDRPSSGASLGYEASQCE
jgi:hypothetical protein